MPTSAPNNQGLRTAAKTTVGGFQTATIFSGLQSGTGAAPFFTAAPGAFNVAADVMFFSGAGRLDTVSVNTPTTSGTPLVFYDASAPISGGPAAASGHKFLCSIPLFPAGAASGVAPSVQPGTPITIGIPFQSGLCCRTTSGQPTFTVCWTPETAGQ